MASEKSTLRPLRTFRLVCQKEEIPQVEALLTEQGYRFEPEPFSPWVRRLIEEPKPLGASLAAFFGLIYIQDRSSMLPPLALAPQEGDAVLDMCASPGSKTGFLAQMVGPEGFVLGNEPSRNRLATLRQNLFNLNLVQAATCSYSGEQLALPSGMWDLIQLDPPCSGWGTVERNPKVLDLWQGEKIKPLIALQRQLLREAKRLLKAGGKVVFSTCTTNVDENEGQVRFAIDELGLELIPLAPMAGFTFAKPMLEGCEGVWRVDPQGEQLEKKPSDAEKMDDAEQGGQGFFVAALRKPLTSDEATKSQDDGDADTFCPEAHAEERRARVNAHKRHYPDTFTPMQAAPVHPKSLEQGGVDTSLLPSGQISIFGDSARFLPAKALELLPAGFKWQGCALGKAAQRGDIRVFPRLRCLMPQVKDAQNTGALAVNIDDINDITRLLTGQSLSIETANKSAQKAPAYKEACLYWRGLRLCRLRLKGNGNVLRAIWSER